MKSNDFKNYESEWVDIWLDNKTQNNKVICETEPASVYNVGNMNLIKGSTKRNKVDDFDLSDLKTKISPKFKSD